MDGDAGDMPSIIHRGLDAELDSIMLEGFVCGVYTLLFAYTLKRLVQTPNKKIYTAALFVLWALVMITFSFDWILLRSVMVINNSSPENMFITLDTNGHIRHLENAFSAASTLLADAILIWRCCTLWAHKKWALLPLPVALVANIIIGFFVFFLPSSRVLKIAAAYDDLILAFFFLSGGITAVGTVLIIMRILLVTRESHISTQYRAYRRIQAIVLESGVIYSIGLLVSAITLAVEIHAKWISQTTAQVVGGYSDSLLTPITGIAPTLIAARVGMEAEGVKQNETRPLTHLMFKKTTKQANTSSFGSDSCDTEGSSRLDGNHSEKEGHVGIANTSGV